jgi:hypothetical protein
MVLHHLFAGTNLTDGFGRKLATLSAGPLTDLPPGFSTVSPAGPTAKPAAAAASVNRLAENPFVEGDKNEPPFPLR